MKAKQQSKKKGTLKKEKRKKNHTSTIHSKQKNFNAFDFLNKTFLFCFKTKQLSRKEEQKQEEKDKESFHETIAFHQ